MSAYLLQDVGFAYGEGPEVLSVDRLEIPSGSVTALVGPNGSGKSTLLQILAFLVLPRRGTVRYDDEPVTQARLDRLRRKATLLLQNPYLFGMTVRANVEWGLGVRNIGAVPRARRALDALKEVGLDGMEDRNARELSGGEGQRLALARLIALEPSVLLLDEPTNHLDTESRQRIETTIRRWNRERGATVVLATHDHAQAWRLGAKVWQVDEGRVSEGEPDNVFRGRLSAAEPDLFEAGALRVRVHAASADTECVRIHPREILLSREVLPSSARNSLPGTIRSAEMAGRGEVRVTLDCGEDLVVIITEESWQKLGLTVGSTALASFKASSVRTC